MFIASACVVRVLFSREGIFTLIVSATGGKKSTMIFARLAKTSFGRGSKGSFNPKNYRRPRSALKDRRPVRIGKAYLAKAK